MNTRSENKDEVWMRKTFDLARASQKSGDHPFGAIIVRDNTVIVESQNTGTQDVTGHAEANAIRMAIEKIGCKDLSEYTLYSNFEPCAMCCFLIRDFNIGRVVFSVPSPHWGGYTRWDILTSEVSNPLFTSAQKTAIPEVCAGILEKEGSKMFSELGWEMHKPDILPS